MKRIPLIILIPIVLLTILCAFFFGSDAKFGIEFFKDPFLIGIMVVSVILLFIYEALDRAIEIYRISTLSEEEKAKALEENKKTFWESIKESAFQKQSEKEEKDLIIDHGFDGITELDNSLPKWWLSLFYITILYAGVYLVAATTSSFSDPKAEYQAEVEYANAHKVKPTFEMVITEAKYDPGMVAAGEKLFEANCVSCHLKGGAGSSGPNLTDEFWKNQRQKDIYQNIVDVVWNGGSPGTAMVKWGDEEKLTQEEVYQVAAYVQSLRGTKPAKPKAAEGTLAPWSSKTAAQGDASTEAKPAADSTAIAQPKA